MSASEKMEWEATMFRSGDYIVYRNSAMTWQAMRGLQFISENLPTFGLAFAACEKHKAEQEAKS